MVRVVCKALPSSLNKTRKTSSEVLKISFQNMPEATIKSIENGDSSKTIFRCPNFVDNFLRTAESFVEDTIPHTYDIGCENGYKVAVHKVVLASSSPYLYKIFKSLSDWKHPSVIVTGITSSLLNHLTRFMYTGQAEVPNDEIKSFLIMAKNLQIRGFENIEAIPLSPTLTDHEYCCNQEQNKGPVANNLDLLAAVACSMSKVDLTPSNPEEGKKVFPRMPLKIAIKSPDSKYFTTNKENVFSLNVTNKTVSMKVSRPFSQVNNNEAPSPRLLKKIKITAKEYHERPTVFRKSSITSSQEDFSEWKKQLGERRKRLSGTLNQTGACSKPALSDNSYLECTPSTSSYSSSASPSSAKDDAYLTCLPSTSSGISASTGKTTTKTTAKKSARKTTSKSANWKSRQPMECEVCQKIFSNKFNLKQHVYNMHFKGGEVKCKECDKLIKNKWYLRRHMVTSHGAPLNKKNTAKTDEDSDDDYSMEESFKGNYKK